MRQWYIMLWALLFSAMPLQSAFSQSIPSDVLTAYKTYAAVLKDKGAKAALPHAKEAWELAEKSIGDHKTTGDLAYNYGYLALRLGEFDDALQPLKRSADLAEMVPDVGAKLRIEREVQVSNALLAAGKENNARDRAEDALEFAEANNLGDNIYTAELLVNMARVYSTKANNAARRKIVTFSQSVIDIHKNRNVMIQSQSADYAEMALSIFDKHPDQQEAESEYIALAHKLIGFAYERDKKWKEALLAYQRAMEIQKDYRTLDDPSYVTTIGRWMNARTHFTYKKTNKEAYAEGLCKCWPYDKEEEIRARSIKRFAPKMPSKARTSGFSIVRFDLSDDGKVINEEIVHSWPEKIFDKSSLKAVRKWQYETKADGKPGAQRTGIVTTVVYHLHSYNSKAPI